MFKPTSFFVLTQLGMNTWRWAQNSIKGKVDIIVQTLARYLWLRLAFGLGTALLVLSTLSLQYTRLSFIISILIAASTITFFSVQAWRCFQHKSYTLGGMALLVLILYPILFAGHWSTPQLTDENLRIRVISKHRDSEQGAVVALRLFPPDAQVGPANELDVNVEFENRFVNEVVIECAIHSIRGHYYTSEPDSLRLVTGKSNQLLTFLILADDLGTNLACGNEISRQSVPLP